MAVKKTYYHSDDGNYFELTEYSSHMTCEIHDKNGRWKECVEGKSKDEISETILNCMPYDAYFLDHEIVEGINSYRDWMDYIKTGETPAELEEEERQREEAEILKEQEDPDYSDHKLSATLAMLERYNVEGEKRIAAQKERELKVAEAAKRLDEENALQEALEIANSILEEQGVIVEKQPVKEEPGKEIEDESSDKNFVMPELDETPVAEYFMPDLDDFSTF